MIVPTYRRPGPLAACLDSLAALEFPRERYEVVVVDDGSGSPPIELVDSFRHRMTVTLLTRENGGPGAARNSGALAARGEYLAFTDDDCLPERDWLRALDAQLARTPDAAVGGRTVNALRENACSEASQLLVSYLYEYYAAPGRAARRFFTTNNLALPAASFAALGGFDLRSLADTAEDRDLCARWCESGRALVYTPEAVVRHAHVLTPRTLWRQHFHYGRGAVYFHRARLHGGGGNHGTVRREPLRFYVDMLAYPLRVQPPVRRAALQVALIALTQLAYGSGYYLERVWPRLSPPTLTRADELRGGRAPRLAPTTAGGTKVRQG